MRRGSGFLFAIAALGAFTSSSFGQYYYPQMAQPYGQPGYMMPYPPQQPMYYQPQQMRPMQMPMPMQMAQPAPRVYNFGPLNETIVPANEAPAKPLPRADHATPIPLMQGQAPAQQSSSGYRPLAVSHRKEVVPEACGPDCADGTCGPNACGPAGCGPMGCGPVTPYVPHRGRHGHGHFIGETGAYFVVPFVANRNAFTNTTTNSTTEFPRVVEYGLRASLGYIFHNTWGGRFNYTYLNGDSNVATSNSLAATNITTTGPGPLAITGPSPALGLGIGTDNYNFRQRIELHVGEFEFLKECHCFDTTLLIGAGLRYARLQQSYNATRANTTGVNAGGNILVALDQDDLEVTNRFEGWGPTVSFEAIHPVAWGFALYGNTRGSFLWGSETVNQTLRSQQRRVVNVVNTFTDTSTSSTSSSNPFVTTAEVELGIQYGFRVGRCYVFSRVGGTASRWWNVGSPTTTTGHLSFVGGTAMLGVTY